LTVLSALRQLCLGEEQQLFHPNVLEEPKPCFHTFQHSSKVRFVPMFGL
jgi:hypothetical protein